MTIAAHYHRPGWFKEKFCERFTEESIKRIILNILLSWILSNWLPPMTDKVLYHWKPNGQLATEGFCVHHKFDKVVKFTVNQRAQGDSIDQEDFRNILVNARDGNTTVDAWNKLLAKAPDKIPNLDQFEQQAIK